MNERTNFLLVRELLMRSPPEKIHCILRREYPLVTHVENPSKCGGTLDVGLVQTGWESF